jgi:transposase
VPAACSPVAADDRFHCAHGQRLESLVVLVDAFDSEIADLTESIAHVFRDDVGYWAIQEVPGIGPIIAANFVAEIGDVHRFKSAAHLEAWCGLTPRHRASDTTVRRGPIISRAPS